MRHAKKTQIGNHGSGAMAGLIGLVVAASGLFLPSAAMAQALVEPSLRLEVRAGDRAWRTPPAGRFVAGEPLALQVRIEAPAGLAWRARADQLEAAARLAEARGETPQMKLPPRPAPVPVAAPGEAWWDRVVVLVEGVPLPVRLDEPIVPQAVEKIDMLAEVRLRVDTDPRWQGAKLVRVEYWPPAGDEPLVWEQALTFVPLAAATAPERAQVAYNQAVEAYDGQRWDEALGLLREALRLGLPDPMLEAAAWGSIGRIAEWYGELDAAVDAYETAIAVAEATLGDRWRPLHLLRMRLDALR